MDRVTREHRVVDWSWFSRVARPRSHTQRITVQIEGLTSVDALIARPEHPTGVTAHFVGFNIAMNPWEEAKAAILADTSNTAVVMCELPGFSRQGGPLPPAIRDQLAHGDPRSWAEATWTCLAEAIRVAKTADDPEQLAIMGYSTGCALAVAAMPTIQTRHTVTRLTLIEPVSLLRRGIAQLAVDNTVDVIGSVGAMPGNLATPWVREVIKQNATDPGIHFSRADFKALVTMLASADTRVRLERDARAEGTHPWPPTDLVRGKLSRLTSASAFTSLDAALAKRAVTGRTYLIPKLGHQLWHSTPALAALAHTVNRVQATVNRDA